MKKYYNNIANHMAKTRNSMGLEYPLMPVSYITNMAGYIPKGINYMTDQYKRYYGYLGDSVMEINNNKVAVQLYNSDNNLYPYKIIIFPYVLNSFKAFHSDLFKQISFKEVDDTIEVYAKITTAKNKYKLLTNPVSYLRFKK
uniref:Uncharacterized protein n=1 Tax=viral metagenome TaxID=1070528 RepID=A0A6C0ESN6_9ZZZZ